MRRIARGIYPPLLEAEGLATALTAIERTFDRPVTVSVSGVGRYPKEVEETVYFGALTAITAALAGGATAVDVSIEESEGSLEITVDSDAPEAPAMTALVDRVEALGGTIDDGGSRLVASLPTGDLEVVDA